MNCRLESLWRGDKQVGDAVQELECCSRPRNARLCRFRDEANSDGDNLVSYAYSEWVEYVWVEGVEDDGGLGRNQEWQKLGRRG